MNTASLSGTQNGNSMNNGMFPLEGHSNSLMRKKYLIWTAPSRLRDDVG